MGTLKEEAAIYEGIKTLNIADLDKIPVNINVKDGEGKTKDKDGKEVVFKYKYIEYEGRQYRVPGVVMGDIKAILEKMPNITHVSVTKTGEALQTRYQVIPWQDVQQQKPPVEQIQ